MADLNTATQLSPMENGTAALPGAGALGNTAGNSSSSTTIESTSCRGSYEINGLCPETCIWLACQSPYVQTALATLVTWGGTALGAAVVLVLPIQKTSRAALVLLDASLGFAAGMMLTAAYFSMLATALEESQKTWKHLRFIPVSAGYVIGALFVIATGYFDVLAKSMGCGHDLNRVRSRENSEVSPSQTAPELHLSKSSMTKILAICLSITIHNIPEGIAVGVGFAAGDESKGIATSLAIALQNLPEGLAVAMPLRAAGQSKMTAFFWGQLSGVVEPIFGLLAVAVVSFAQALLPYALAFSAGCMIYVVIEDIIPVANERDNGSLAAKVSVLGVLVMIGLDTGLEVLT